EVAGDLALILRRVDRRDVEAVTDLLEVEIGDVSPGGVLGCGAAADGEGTGRPLRDGGVRERGLVHLQGARQHRTAARQRVAELEVARHARRVQLRWNAAKIDMLGLAGEIELQRTRRANGALRGCAPAVTGRAAIDRNR